MRARHWLALPVAAAVGMGLALWRVANLDGELDWRALVTPAGQRRWVVPALVLAGCCWLGWLTWLGVRRLRERPEKQTTYRYGVVAFGSAWGAVMVALRAVQQVRSLAPDGHPSWSLTAEVVLREAVIAFPLALWGGYVVGRVLSYFFDRLGVGPR